MVMTAITETEVTELYFSVVFIQSARKGLFLLQVPNANDELQITYINTSICD